MTLAAAVALLEVGRAGPARQLVAEVLVAEPHSAEALCLLARCHRALHDYPAMLAAADAAAANAPGDATPHLLRADALLQLDRPAEALLAAEAAVRLAPDLAGAHLVRGLALLGTGRRRDGWAALREATRLAPEWPTGHFVAGSMHHSVGDVRKAKQAYRRTLRLQPDHSGALEGLGHLALTAGRLGAAVRSFGAAGAADPQARAASAGLDRALRGLAARALLTGWLLGCVMSFARYWPAWPIGGAMLAAYCVGVAAFWRKTPAALRPVVRYRLRSDSRVRNRAVLGALGIAGAVVLGVYAGFGTGPEDRLGPAHFLAAATGSLLVAVVLVLAGDAWEGARHRSQAPKAPAAALAELAPEERSTLDVGRLVLRWVRAAALGAVIPWFLAVEPAPWPQRAITGTICAGLLALYYWWSLRRWRRQPGRPLPPAMLPFMAAIYMILTATWIGTLAVAFWPGGGPPDVVLVVLLLTTGGTLLTQAIWLPVALARRAWRRVKTGFRSDGYRRAP